MTILLGRQPIICKYAEIIGYELLYRDSKINFCDPTQESDVTEKLIRRNRLEYGVGHITDGKKAMINFSEDALLVGLAKRLPVKNVVIEILETVNPSDEVYEACCELSEMGYELALDDFVYDENWARFLNIVQIVKIDVIVTPLNTIGSLIHKIKNLESTLHGSRPKLLAEKIETVKVYEEAKTLGFDYFQGYLFGKPELVTCNIQQLLTA